MGLSDYRRRVWAETVTVYHRILSIGPDGKTATSWARFVVSGCFYGWRWLRRAAGMDWVDASVRVVRIPAGDVPAGFAIGVGDVIVRGSVDDVLVVNASPTALTRKYGDEAFIADKASDNRGLTRTAHYYASEGARDGT